MSFPDVTLLSVKRPPQRILGAEYGGEIVELSRGPNGTALYTFTGPRTDGSEAGFTPNVNVAGFAGDYHSHGAASFGRYLDEEFSSNPSGGGDIQGINAPGQPGYLVTPSGRMLKYDPDTNRNPSGQVVQIGIVPPRPPKSQASP